MIARTILALGLSAGLSAGLLPGTAPPTAAQEVPRYFGPFVSDPNYPAVLILNGDIGPGAMRHFREALLEEEVLTLVLNSPGGAILTALEIAAITSDKGLETIIPETATCASACAFIFLAGEFRYAAGRLGVHQFYAPEDEVELGSVTRGETQDMAGTIIKYLDSFETPSAVYIRMLGTPPDQMYWFPQDELLAEGIVTGPLDFFPAIPFDRYETYVAPALPPVEDPAPAASATPPAAPEPEPQPAPEPEPEPERVSRPSFDCNLAATPTERTLCSDPDLGDKDRRMAETYLRLRAEAGSTARQRLLDEQRAFLRTRNACGSDTGCLNAVYDQRIAELEAD